MDRHYFPGGNCPQGFVSFFDGIADEREARRGYYIKGGPGTGKSTLMRRIAGALSAGGAETEYFHCSSDPQSLDAVAVPSLGFFIMDGTSPHVRDAQYPGVRSYTIDMGAYWDEALLREKSEAIELFGAYKHEFECAYHFLGAAACVTPKSAHSERHMNAGRYDAAHVAFEILGGIPIAEHKGRTRTLFLSAISPDGCVNYIREAAEGRDIVCTVRGRAEYTGAALQYLYAAALERGLDVICCPCPMDTSRIEHLLIPRLSTLITTLGAYSRAEVSADYTLEGDMEVEGDDHRELEIAYADLLAKGINHIHEAREQHARLEKLYIPAMDFSKLPALAQRIASEVLD